jgi:LmbE family N-acetylglucosaminyl deacetylase
VFHAHPDDEALLTAGTMARASAEGHRVVLVVATDGGLGRTRAALGAADDLGRVRLGELDVAARLLGVHRLVYLGYADSGAAQEVPPDPAGRVRFGRAPIAKAAGMLAAVLSEEHADVLVTDDAGGGYGHRDHIRAHRVGATAARFAGTPHRLEATIPVVYSPARSITHCVDVSPYIPLKRAALAAHASQSSRDTGGDRGMVRWLRLPQAVFGWAFKREWFIDETAGRRLVRDVFA